MKILTGDEIVQVKNIDTIPWAIACRLRLIDVLLGTVGVLNRSVLVEYFGISVPQASYDISQYRDLAPNNLYYDSSKKCYCANVEFVRVWK